LKKNLKYDFLIIYAYPFKTLILVFCHPEHSKGQTKTSRYYN